MSTRVIDDPTALGWVLDPATGRYEWGGGSSGGGGGDCNIPILDSPPANPELGERFFSSTDGYMYIWYGSEWVAIGGAGGGDGGGTGPEPEPEPDPDPYWPNVGLLINCDGEADESQNVVDASGKNQVTVVNSAKVSTDTYKYGTGALNLSGGAGYLQLNNMSTALTGSNNFTLETWIYRNPSAAYQYLYTTGNSCQIMIHGNKFKMMLSSDGSTSYFVNMVSASDVPTEEWVHLCITRASGTWTMFINGAQEATASAASAIGPANYVQVGAYGNNQYRVDGWLDDFRITNLIARPDYASASWEPPGRHSTEDGSTLTKVITVEEPAVELQEDGNDADLS